MMICNSCQYPITSGDSVTCSVCLKPIHKDCAINDGGTFCDICYINRTEEKNNPTLSFDVPEVIRRSHIELYQTCPFKFYNEVILGHNQPENIYTKLGIDLHDMFDRANTDKSVNEQDMKDEAIQLIHKYDEALFIGMSKAEAMQRANDSIETYFHVTKNMPEPFATEETLQFSVGDGLPRVQATSDRVNKIDNELHVMDWKTGNVMTGMKLSTDLQAPLYIYSIREKYKLPVKSFTFYYLKDNKERRFDRVDHDKYVCEVGKRKYFIEIPEAIKTVQSTFSKIQKGQFNVPINAKSMYYACKMCHIREKGLCEGADMQIWNQFNK